MKELEFSLDNFNLTVFLKDDDILFHARTVAEALGYKDPSSAYAAHCKSLILLDSGDLPESKSLTPHPKGEYFIKEADL